MKGFWLASIIILAISGCRKQAPIKSKSQDSSAEKTQQFDQQVYYLNGLQKSLNIYVRKSTELMFENKWLRQRLHKSLELIEKEKGLEPIEIKHSFPTGPPIITPKSPSYSERRFSRPAEPFFEPYQKPPIKTLFDVNSVPDGNTIPKMYAQINLAAMAIAFQQYATDPWIENFEQRLKRIDPNQQ